MKQRVLGLVFALVLALSATAFADPPPPVAAAQTAPDRLDRLLGLARIWAEVKFFHPAMFQRPIDWDGALIKAIPEIEAATDAASYRAAIGHLLAAIGDPRTTVEPASADGAAPAAWKTWASAGVLVLNARLPGRLDDYAATRRFAAEVRPEIAKASVVVIDLRGRDDEDNRLLEEVLDSLPATSAWPTVRTIEHKGFRSQGESNRDMYLTAWRVESTGAPTPGANPGPRHVVFAVDPRHALPFHAATLWLAGHATLVAPAALDDNRMAVVKRIALPHGVVAQYRTADVALPGGRGLAADAVVSLGDDVRARAIAIATAIAGGGAPPRGPERRASRANPDDLLLADDDASPMTGLPSRERRMLAAIRAWAVIEYFHGTRRLDPEWDRQLRAALPRIEAASDADSYRDALSAMMLATHDGHISVYPIDDPPRAGTAIYWRRIEGKIVAGGLRDEAVARQAGIALGDELVAVDGVPVEEVVVRKLRRIIGGTEESRLQWGVANVDRDASDGTVEVEVRRRDGKLHRASLVRAYGYGQNFWAHQGPHYKLLPSGVGYVDLSRLTSDEIDAMFDALRTSSAIVFDMRGYPNGTGWLIGERINTRATQELAEIRVPLVSAAHAKYGYTSRVLQRGSTSDKPLYRGKVVVLIDDRAVSAAEHLCLVFEATSGATFIGSPTNGTNGEETYVKLPGGLEMRFTGMEIFHADGRQLQQIGIQPQITVRPTLRGLRAGKDEVLDRALRYLQTGK